MLGFVFTQSDGNVTLPAVGADVVVPVFSTDGIVVGQTILVIKVNPTAAQGTFTVVSIDEGVSFTGTFLGAAGDSAPGANVGTNSPVVLLSSPSFGSCDLDAILLSASCYSPFCLNDADREGIAIYARVAALAAAGGTDYTGDIEALRSAAAKWQMLNEKQRHQLSFYHTLQNAITAGADVSTDPDTLKAAAACYICIPDNIRDNLLLYLNCLLSSRGLPA